jgi:quercetin dioxygenase-like cupin family protein
MRHWVPLASATLFLLAEMLQGQTAPSKSKSLLTTTQTRPECCRKLAATDRITAYGITIPPHGSTELRQHPYDYVLLSLTTADIEAAGAAGNTYPMRLEAEEMQVMKGGWAHRLSNRADVEARLLEIDVQPNIAPERASCGLAASQCTDGHFGNNGRGSYSVATLFETPKVKLTKVELSPRGIFALHAHHASQMLIPLTRVHLSDSGESQIEKDAGEVQAYSSATRHELVNLGNETARFLELEVK